MIASNSSKNSRPGRGLIDPTRLRIEASGRLNFV
jgi:hypothetical protein